MREEAFSLGGVPAVVYGEEADRVFLFVHGRCGCKEEGRDFAALAAPFGWQVLAVDLPEHGARQGGPEPLDPWHAVPELQSAMEGVCPGAVAARGSAGHQHRRLAFHAGLR